MTTTTKTTPIALNAHKSGTPAPAKLKRPAKRKPATPKIPPADFTVDASPILPARVGPSAADARPVKLRDRKPVTQPAPAKPEPIAPTVETVRYDVTCMDAYVTIYNPKTREIRRFRVDESRSAGWEGRRIVAVWDKNHYVGFGEASEFGVVVWKKYQGRDGVKSVYEKYASMLESPTAYAARGAVYTVESMDHETD